MLRLGYRNLLVLVTLGRLASGADLSGPAPLGVPDPGFLPPGSVLTPDPPVSVGSPLVVAPAAMPRPATSPRLTPAFAQPPVVRANLPEVLAFDALMKDYTAKPGELSAKLAFSVTNISPSEVLINNVRTSCGCTVAQVPGRPWRLAAGTNGEFSVVVDLRGKFGSLI